MALLGARGSLSPWNPIRASAQRPQSVQEHNQPACFLYCTHVEFVRSVDTAATRALASADACWVPKMLEQPPTPILARAWNFPSMNLEFFCNTPLCYTWLLSTRRR